MRGARHRKLLSRVECATTLAQLMEEGVSLLEHAAVSRHVRDRLGVGLGEDHVEEMPATIGTAAHEGQVLRPEEDDRAHTEHRARRARFAVDRGHPRHPCGGTVPLKTDRQRDVGGWTRHVHFGAVP